MIFQTIQNIQTFICISKSTSLMFLTKIHIKFHLVSIFMLPFMNPNNFFLIIFMIYFLLSFSLINSLQLTQYTCPSDFNITDANATTSQAHTLYNYAHSLYKPYLTNQSNQRMKRIITMNDVDTLKTQLYTLAIPYLCMAGVALIIYCILISCCLFEKQCPPCNSLKRDIVNQPYQKQQFRLGTIILLLFSISIIVICLIAFSSIKNMKLQMKYTKCGAYNVLDSVMYGDISNSWGGFLNIQNSIQNISIDMNNLSSIILTYFSNNSNIINDINYISSLNVNLYQKYSSSKLINPDPITPYGSQVPSRFIMNQLGPSNKSNTMINDIDSSLKSTYKLTNSAYSLAQSTLILNDSIQIIQNKAILVNMLLDMYNQRLNNTIPLIDDFSSVYINNYFNWAIYFYQSVIGMVLIASMLAILGSFSAHSFDVQNCKILMHISWLILGLVYIGIIVLAFVFIPSASIGTQFCIFFQNILNNKTAYEQFVNYDQTNVLSNLKQCIFGDGDIIQFYDISSELQSLTNLFNNNTNFQNSNNFYSKSYVDLTFAHNKILSWIYTMSNYSAGIYIDSFPQQNNNANPYNSLKTLNSYTQGNNTLSNCTLDEWVFNSINCSSKLIFYPTNDRSIGLRLNTTKMWCYSFGQGLTIGSSDWNRVDYQERYKQIEYSCPYAYSKIMQFGQRLIAYRDSRINLFSSIGEDLKNILDLYQNYTILLSYFALNVTLFFQNINSLNYFLNDQMRGIQNMKNCSVIGRNIKFVYNSFCINFMSEIVKVAVCLILLIPLILGVMITANILALRYNGLIKTTETLGDSSQVTLEQKEEKNSKFNLEEED